MRAHDLVAGPACGCQRPTFQYQAAPLLDAQIDPGLASRRRKGLLRNPNLESGTTLGTADGTFTHSHS